MVGARHGRLLPVAALLVAACFSLLLLPPAAAVDELDGSGREAQRNTERISGDLPLLCLALVMSSDC